MDFRELGNGWTVQRPSIDLDDLTEESFTFRGEFDGDSLKVCSAAYADVKGEGVLAHSPKPIPTQQPTH